MARRWLTTTVGDHTLTLWDNRDIEIEGADDGGLCGRLSLEQAIELSTYLNCVIIPDLEKENE